MVNFSIDSTEARVVRDGVTYVFKYVGDLHFYEFSDDHSDAVCEYDEQTGERHTKDEIYAKFIGTMESLDLNSYEYAWYKLVCHLYEGIDCNVVSRSRFDVLQMAESQVMEGDW